jgi:hypothetical protein
VVWEGDVLPFLGCLPMPRVTYKHGVTRENLDLKHAMAGIEFVLWWFRFAFHLFSFLHCDCSVLALVVYDTVIPQTAS